MAGKLRIIGVDPGTATTGYGIVDLVGYNSCEYVCSGIIQTHKTQAMPVRLRIIREDFLSLLETYLPDVVAIESIFFFKNAKTLVPVAQSRGVLIEVANSCGVAVAEYTPMQVKMSVAGYGKANKKELQFIVAKLLNHQTVIQPDDACDAVALAICHARFQLTTRVIVNVDNKCHTF